MQVFEEFDIWYYGVERGMGEVLRDAWEVARELKYGFTWEKPYKFRPHVKKTLTTFNPQQKLSPTLKLTFLRSIIFPLHLNTRSSALSNYFNYLPLQKSSTDPLKSSFIQQKGYLPSIEIFFSPNLYSNSFKWRQ